MPAEIGPKRDRSLARTGCYFDGDAAACRAECVLDMREMWDDCGQFDCDATAAFASPAFPYVNIDVEIDFADAGLRRAMRAALVPAAFARRADIRKLQAVPLRQRT